MREYIQTVIVAGVAGAMATFMCPAGEGGSGKYVKYLSSFVMLLVILSPLRNISAFTAAVKSTVSSVLSEEAEAELPGSTPAVELTAENLSDYIIYICESKFGIPGEGVKVRLVLDEEDVNSIEITEIQVYTGERDAGKRAELKKYLEDTLMCRVYVLGA